MAKKKEKSKNDIKSFMDSMNSTYGEGAVRSMEEDDVADINTFSSGLIGLDLAMGVGGWPKGRITEVYGPESSGKTTLAMHAIAEAQKDGGRAIFIDAEHSFDRRYAKNLGIDLSGDKMAISQPDNGEQALEILEKALTSKLFAVAVVDSVAALTPKAEIEGEMGDSKMGLQARLMSQAMRKITAVTNRSNTCVIFINQLREKIGVMFGNPETTTGGNALKYYASIRLDVRRRSTQGTDDKGLAVSNLHRVKVVKNKLAPPFMDHEFYIKYGVGVDKYTDLLEVASAKDVNIIEQAGSWYSYEGAKLGQGKKTVSQMLEDNPDLYEEIFNKTREFLFKKED